VLNSAPVNFVVKSHSVQGGKGFGTPSMLDYLRLRRFKPGDARHKELASLSRKAHVLVARGEEFADLQESIDQVVADLCGLTGQQMRAIVKSTQ